MIVTVVSHSQGGGRSMVAENLALLRARSVSKVLLLDAASGQTCRKWCDERARSRLRPAIATSSFRGDGLAAELEHLQAQFNDIVIDTDCEDGQLCRAALIAAQLAVVPLGSEDVDVDRTYRLIAQLNSARMFNPRLRVLFVAAGPERTTELSPVRAYASNVLSAGVATTFIHLPALQWGAVSPGHGACDFEDSAGAAEMRPLYEEAYRLSPSGHLSGRRHATPP